MGCRAWYINGSINKQEVGKWILQCFFPYFGLVHGQAAEILLLVARVLPADALDWLVQLDRSPAIASVGAVAVSASVDSLGWLVTGAAGLWAALMALLTWLIAVFRQGFVDMLEQIDGDGSLGLMKLFSLTEGGLAVGLIALLVFLPIIALVVNHLDFDVWGRLGGARPSKNAPHKHRG